MTIQANALFKILDVKGDDEQVSVKIDDSDAAQLSHTVRITMNLKAKGGLSRIRSKA